MLEPLIENTDGVLLSLNLTAIALDHGVALVLKSLILGLSLHELTLQLLKLL